MDFTLNSTLSVLLMEMASFFVPAAVTFSTDAVATRSLASRLPTCARSPSSCTLTSSTSKLMTLSPFSSAVVPAMSTFRGTWFTVRGVVG